MVRVSDVYLSIYYVQQNSFHVPASGGRRWLVDVHNIIIYDIYGYCSRIRLCLYTWVVRHILAVEEDIRYIVSYYIIQLLISPCPTTMNSRDTRQRRHTGRRRSLLACEAAEAAPGAIITPRVHPFSKTPQTRPLRKQPSVESGAG